MTKPYWEMTKEEFYAPVEIPNNWAWKGYKGFYNATGLYRIVSPDGESLYPLDDWLVVWGRSNNPFYHGYLVKKAYDEGKPIPAENKEEYDID